MKNTDNLSIPDDLPIIDLNLAHNPPAELSHMQEALLPYLSQIETGYWVVWSLTLVYLTCKYLLKPLLSKFNNE